MQKIYLYSKKLHHLLPEIHIDAVMHQSWNPEGEGMGVSDLKTESKRGRGRERAGTVSTTQLPAESAEIQSPAQKLTESRQNAAASTGKHRPTQQRHGLWPQNTDSKWQQGGSKALGCRNALKFFSEPRSVIFTFYIKWRNTGTIHLSGRHIWKGGKLEILDLDTDTSNPFRSWVMAAL